MLATGMGVSKFCKLIMGQITGETNKVRISLVLGPNYDDPGIKVNRPQVNYCNRVKNSTGRFPGYFFISLSC